MNFSLDKGLSPRLALAQLLIGVGRNIYGGADLERLGMKRCVRSKSSRTQYSQN